MSISSTSSPPINQLQARFFYTFTLAQNNRILPLPTLSKANLLLIYLLFYRHKRHSRLFLITLLWPHATEAVGREKLRQVLWHIRRILPDLIVTDADHIQIDPDISLWTDVATFETLITPWLPQKIPPLTAEADLRQAIALYRGELLATYYEDWLLLERTRLAEMYRFALECLLLLQKMKGDYQNALQTALKLTQIDPLRESTHREIMRLHLAFDRPRVALDYFETIRQRLKTELAVAPEAATLALYQKIKQQQSPFIPPQTAFPLTPAPNTPPFLAMPRAQIPFIGRRQIRKTALSYVRQVLQRDKTDYKLILIEGEAGIGKSHLLQTLADDIEWHGLQVLWGDSPAALPDKPYGLLRRALVSGFSTERMAQLSDQLAPFWLARLKQILPEINLEIPADQPTFSFNVINVIEVKEYILETFTQILMAWAKSTPLILLLEDLHKACADTLTLLQTMLDRLKPYPILIIATCRPFTAETQPILATLRQKSFPHLQYLPPLTTTETRALVCYCLGTPVTDFDFEMTRFKKTWGNPLLILETLQILYEDDSLYQDEKGYWSLKKPQKTQPEQKIITNATYTAPAIHPTQNRLGRLSAINRQLLEAAATLGNNISLPLLQTLTQLPTETLQAVLTDLTKQKFLEETSKNYQFSHEQLRQITYQKTASKQRTQHHRQIAYTLEQKHLSEKETLAYHFSQGQVWDKAITYTLEATKIAQRLGSYQNALTHTTQLLHFLSEFNDRTLPQYTKIYIETLLIRCRLFWFNKDDENYALTLQELKGVTEMQADATYQTQYLNQKAHFLHQVENNYQAAVETAQMALTLANQHTLSDQQVKALLSIGEIYMIQGNHHQSIVFLEQALTHTAYLLNNPSVRLRIHFYLQTNYSFAGMLEKSKATLALLWDLTKQIQDPLWVINMKNLQAGYTTSTAQYWQSTIYLEEGIAQAHHFGLTFKLPILLHNLGLYSLYGQRYKQAQQTLQQGLALATQQANPRLIIAIHILLSYLYLLTGYSQKTETHLTEAQLHTEKHPELFSYKRLIQIIWGHLYLAQHHLDKARHQLNLLFEQGLNSQNISTVCRIYFLRGLVAWTQDDVATAATWFEQAHHSALQYPGRPDRVALYRAYLAWCWHKLNKPDKAIALSKQAYHAVLTFQGGEQAHVVYFIHWRIMYASNHILVAQTALEKAYANLQAQKEQLADATWSAAFLNDAPFSHQIIEDYRAIQITKQTSQQEIHLPHVNAPTGRPLTLDDLVTVIWMIDHPTDATITSKVARRQHKLLRLLTQAQQQQASPTIKHLANALQVSPRTIKRDLALLRQAGYDTPTRGHH